MKFITKRRVTIFLFILIIISLFLFLTKSQIIKEKMSYKYYEKANELASQGEIDSAIFYYEKAIKINPDNYIFYYRAGNESYAQKRLDNAENYFEKTLTKNPDNNTKIDSYSNLNQIYIFKEKYDEAINLGFEWVKKEDDTHFKKYGYLMIALSQTLIGENKEASTFLAKAKELESLDNEKDDFFQKIEFNFNYIYEILFSENYDNLIEKIEKTETFNKEEKNLLLSQIYYQLEEYDKVLNLLDEITTKNILDPKLLLMKGVTLLQKNKTIEAKEYFHDLLSYLNDYDNLPFNSKKILKMGAYLGLSECMLREEKNEEALNYLSEVNKLSLEIKEIKNYVNKIDFYMFLIMTRYKTSEIYSTRNENEKALLFLTDIDILKEKIPVEIWKKINQNYWPKEKNITLEEKISNLKKILNNE